MAKAVRLAKVAREINVGIDTIAAHLRKKGFNVDVKPTTKLSAEMHAMLLKDFRDQIALKKRADKIQISFRVPKTKQEEESATVIPSVKKILPQKPTDTEVLVISPTSEAVVPPPRVSSKEEQASKKEVKPLVEAPSNKKIALQTKPTSPPLAPLKEEEPKPPAQTNKRVVPPLPIESLSVPTVPVVSKIDLPDKPIETTTPEKVNVPSAQQETLVKGEPALKQQGVSEKQPDHQQEDAKVTQKEKQPPSLPSKEEPTPVVAKIPTIVEKKLPKVEEKKIPNKLVDKTAIEKPVKKQQAVEPLAVSSKEATPAVLPSQEKKAIVVEKEKVTVAKEATTTRGVLKEKTMPKSPQEDPPKKEPTIAKTIKTTTASTPKIELTNPPKLTKETITKQPKSIPTTLGQRKLVKLKDKNITKNKPVEERKKIVEKATQPKNKSTQKSVDRVKKPSVGSASENKPISSIPLDLKNKDSESPSMITSEKNTLESPKIVGKINLSGVNMKTRPEKRKDRKGHHNQRNRDRRKDRRDGDRGKEDRLTNKEHPSNRTKDLGTSKTDTRPKQQEQKGIEKKSTPPKEVKKVTRPVVVKPPVVEKEEQQTRMETVVPQLQGPKIIGKIELPVIGRSGRKKSDKESGDNKDNRNKRKRRRKRIVKVKTEGGASTGQSGSGSGTGTEQKTGDKTTPPRPRKKIITKRSDQKRRRSRKTKDTPTEVSEKEIQEKIKATMAKLSGGAKSKSSRSKLRRQKREQAADKRRLQEELEDNNLLQVTEFVSVSDLAKLMDTAVNNVITTCFNLGIMVSINQRLDAEVIELVTEEFGYEVEFISATEEGEEEEEIVDAPEDLKPRSPIVTIMGHVDHGKTSLLDYIRNANVVGDEMGGITQHIGAYEVATESGHSITFLDTPGHEAFTAMRARGAKVTDVAVIVIAADDSVMPQTKEAISHAQAAGVPMVFAINKVDKPDAFPDRIKEQLANMNILVEDWGGDYQSQEVSAKSGLNVDELLEKISLQAELLELKANPDRRAIGTVIEASLDKGRGYVTTVLVQTGVLKIGDIVLSGQYTGRVKAMFNERGKRVKKAGPSQPVLVLGLNGAPQAGDRVKVMESEQEARSIGQRRKQLVREQQQRASKHITLEEIGRRLALGNFKELNLIVKGDVDGSVEALSDSLLKLSTEEIQVRIIHRAVGPIIGSDVLLASASDAIIIGFQVRPTLDARRQAEQESIDIRMYAIIYDAIEEIKSAMEGMLEPTVEERFVCNVEVKETFKVSKIGTIAGCYVAEGKVYPDTKIRLVRDGIVVYTGEIGSLKRYKDDVKEVLPGQECGIAIKNFNDIKVGDVVEGYEEVKIKRTLADVRK